MTSKKRRMSTTSTKKRKTTTKKKTKNHSIHKNFKVVGGSKPKRTHRGKKKK
jgi:hypothetical protein